MEGSNIIARFCSAVKESEKERLISSSGSTREPCAPSSAKDK